MEIAFVLQCFSPFLLISTACIRVLENPYSSKVADRVVPRLRVSSSPGRACFGHFRGVHMGSLASLRLEAPVSLTVCLIVKLGDSYL